MSSPSRHHRASVYLLAVLAAAVTSCSHTGKSLPDDADRPPSILFILADDLGYGEVGCYGQTKIRTPNLDRLAAEGMRFTQHYSGSPVCASSRCVLLTGKHTGNAYVRDNHEVGGWGPNEPEGQLPLPEGTVTIGSLLQSAGYRTGCIGKWGLGGPESTGHPNRQGFDFYYGYLCQRVAHNYYPTHLWRNENKEILAGNEYFRAHQRFPEDANPEDPAEYERYSGEVYSQDPMAEEALRFIRENRDRPFFLFVPFLVPHVAIQVPQDSLDEYVGAFPETPYLGDKGYLPHPTPRAGYAAMITRMDREIGRMLDLLTELGLDEDTLVVFSSDNGPTFNGGTDSDFFNSAGPLRGMKTWLYEGGIRVPMVARWKGRIAPGSVTDHVSAFQDVLPTLAEVAGLDSPPDIDGISMMPTLLGKGRQRQHEWLYFEFHGRKSQAVRLGDWKGIRTGLAKNPNAPIELYDLSSDVAESTDIAGLQPDVVARISDIMATRTPSHLDKWNFAESP